MITAVALIGVILLGGLAVLQVLLIAGAPLGRFAWGGQNVVLPARLRIGSAVSVALYAVFAVLMLQVERAQRIAAGDLEAACAATALIGLDWALARRAGEIAERYALRGYDAVHLASALDAQDPELVLVTWDRHLALAATTAGLAVIPR